MVDTSLMVVVFALLPIVPKQFGISDEVAWRLCSGLFVAAVIGFMMVARRRQQRLAAKNIRISVAFARLLWVLGLTISAVLAIGASGLTAASAAFYTLALLLSLIVSCTIFTLVLASILMPMQTDRDAS